MEIIEPFWKGLIIGIMFTLTFGTVFFSLIQTSIKRGLRKSLLIAFGVLLSDSTYISIAVFGSTFISDSIRHYDHMIRIIGCGFLLFLGIRSIIIHEKIRKEESTQQERSGILYILKGIMLNSINPMVLIAWLGVTTYVETVSGFGMDRVIFFFSIVLMTMFSSMCTICYFARKLGNVMSEKNTHRLHIFSGAIFILFAIVIIWPLTGI